MKALLLFLLVACCQRGFGQTDTNIITSIQAIHLKPPGELTLQISVPSKEIKVDGTVSAFLILSNRSSQSVRFSKECNPLRNVGPGDRFDVDWMRGYWFSDGPSEQQFAKSAQILRPGESAELPFEIIVGTNKALHISAHYDTSLVDKRWGWWYGRVDAEPVTIQFDK